MTAPASYEIEEIMEALKGVYQDLETGDTFGGQPATLNAYATVSGNADVPAIVFELDTLQWDLNMGGGADGLGIVATVLLQTSDSEGAQEALWRFLSRRETTGVGRLKAALDADPTLGGLVHYAQMATARRTGLITYDGVDYMGAELVIEVVA